MLNFGQATQTSRPEGLDANAGIVPLDLRWLFGCLRRHSRLIGGFAAGTLCLGIVYILTTPNTYSASATVLIDARHMALFRQSSLFEEAALNTSIAESELQVVLSRRVAESVVRRFDLVNDPDFMNPPGNLVLDALRNAVASVRRLLVPSSGAPRDPMVTATNRLAENLIVRRLSPSFVLQIVYQAPTAKAAADIANAVAAAYIADRMTARIEAAEQAAGWLEDKIEGLRERVTNADREVQTFRASNSMISAGGGTSLGEARVHELNSQLLAARNETAQARARLQRIREVIATDALETGVAEMLTGEVAKQLRLDELDVARREREATERFGAGHFTTAALRLRRAELRASIRQELKRLAEVYQSTAEIAEARLKQLEEGFARQLQDSAGTMQALVHLRELESKASSSRALYDSFIQHHLQTSQQQSFPVSDVRTITAAVMPTSAAWPRPIVILPLSVLLGLFLGVGAALAREAIEVTVRTPRQLEGLTQTDCLGILPLVKKPARWAEHRHGAFGRGGSALPRGGAGDAAFRGRIVLDAPFSRFAETIRGLRIAIDANQARERSQVIGLISAVSGEGKSVVAANVARWLAHSGQRTLLIDLDLRRPESSRIVAAEAGPGIADVVAGRATLEEAVRRDAFSDLDVLPAHAITDARSGQFVASDAMNGVMAACRERYERIVVDLPPLLSVAETRSALHLVDVFLLVVEWGRTSADAVEEAAQGTPAVRDKLIGCVLNKVDLRMLSSYEPARDGYYASRAPY